MSKEAQRNLDAALASRSALKEMLVIALPAVASMLSFSLMQFVDRLLISSLIGPDALAGAGNGGIAAWVPASVLMGLLGVINTYVSQNLGAGRPERGAAYAWAGVWMSVLAWLFILMPYALVFPYFYSWLRATLELPAASAHVAQMEAVYGRTMLMCTLLTLIARALGHYFYGMHRPAIVMVSTITGNVVNLGAAYLLITRAMATPGVATEELHVMGVQAAAIGTVIGTAVECLIPLVIFLSPGYARKLDTRAAWRPAWGPIRDILRIGWPGGLMFGNEMVCWFVFMGCYVPSFDKDGQTLHNSAGWIAHQYLMLSFMPAVGISFAVTAVVGKSIGMGRPDIAQARTWLGVRLTMAYMGLCALCFVFLGRQMAGVYLNGAAVDPEQRAQIIELARWMLILAATFQLFDGMAITLSGALRGAGDTVWPGIATLCLSWTVIVGGGWVAVKYLPQFSSTGPWAAASIYVILLALCLLWRFLGGHWKRITLIDRATAPGAEGLGDPGIGEAAMAPAMDVPDLADTAEPIQPR